MIARIGALFGFWSLVWTRDHDGETRLRKVWEFRHWRDAFTSSTFRGSAVYGICCPPMFWSMKNTTVGLLKDGTCLNLGGQSYVKHWKEWEHNRKHVVFD